MENFKYQIRIFLNFFILVLFIGVLGWGIWEVSKKLSDLFLWETTLGQTSSQGEELLADVSNVPDFLKPTRNWEIEDIKIKAESALCVETSPLGQDRILFKKNEDKKLPIASLAKLMTALVALKNYNLNETIKISKTAISQEGEQGLLKPGENLSIENLLYIMLIESSNDAAFALSEKIGTKQFVDLMNLEALNLGLFHTYFSNPTGLGKENYSTAEDLIKLTEYLLNNYPFVWETLSFKEFQLYTPDGVFHHKLVNTNELLGEVPEIIAGKTGWTPLAKGCLLVVANNSKKTSHLIYIILGSDNRFEEMKQLIEWINTAYRW